MGGRVSYDGRSLQGSSYVVLSCSLRFFSLRFIIYRFVKPFLHICLSLRRFEFCYTYVKLLLDFFAFI